MCADLGFCSWPSLALNSAQFSLMKNTERKRNSGVFMLSWRGILFPAGSHPQPIGVPWVQVSCYGPILPSQFLPRKTGRFRKKCSVLVCGFVLVGLCVALLLFVFHSPPVLSIGSIQKLNKQIKEPSKI